VLAPQVNLDLARAYAMSSKDAAAVNLLSAAEQLSPQLIGYDQATPDLLPNCCAANTSPPYQNCDRWRAVRQTPNRAWISSRLVRFSGDGSPSFA
jgi:hypothetical protein